MKLFITLCGLPLYIVGILLGLITRPIVTGYLTGYFYLELKTYDQLLTETQETIETEEHS